MRTKAGVCRGAALQRLSVAGRGCRPRGSPPARSGGGALGGSGEGGGGGAAGGGTEGAEGPLAPPAAAVLARAYLKTLQHRAGNKTVHAADGSAAGSVSKHVHQLGSTCTPFTSAPTSQRPPLCLLLAPHPP